MLYYGASNPNVLINCIKTRKMKGFHHVFRVCKYYCSCLVNKKLSSLLMIWWNIRKSRKTENFACMLHVVWEAPFKSCVKEIIMSVFLQKLISCKIDHFGGIWHCHCSSMVKIPSKSWICGVKVSGKTGIAHAWLCVH